MLRAGWQSFGGITKDGKAIIAIANSPTATVVNLAISNTVWHSPLLEDAFNSQFAGATHRSFYCNGVHQNDSDRATSCKWFTLLKQSSCGASKIPDCSLCTMKSDKKAKATGIRHSTL